MKKMYEYLSESKKKQKIFFTSDLHFGDERLYLYGRDLVFKNAKDFELAIIKNWNNVVSKDDLVIVVGDVAFSRDDLNVLDKLNGEKWLVKGNYDISPEKGGTAKFDITDDLLKKYFTKVVDDMEIKINDEKIYINHFPTNADYRFCICGHIHGTWKVQRNMINVGCDAWHFMPISEDMIKFQINGIRNYYDQNVFAGELLSNINSRSGNIKILNAPEYNNTINDDFVIYLMGPIQGAENWHEKFIKEMSNFKTDKNIIIASPKRKNKDNNFNYEDQIKWETYYLQKAANNGLIFCWISKEINKNEHRSFAQTTRFELGEYFLYGKDIKDFKIIIGVDKSFSGIKYIEYKYKQKYSDFKLYNDFDLAINEVKKILNK